MCLMTMLLMMSQALSWQWAVGSWQLAVGNGQLAMGSWQLAVGNGQLAKGSWQLAKGSWQLAKGSWQLAVGNNCYIFCILFQVKLLRILFYTSGLLHSVYKFVFCQPPFANCHIFCQLPFANCFLPNCQLFMLRQN
jgi:hypothetical protein